MNSRLRITSAGTSALAPARRSMTRKAANSTTQATNRPTMRGSPQPHSGA